MYMVVRVIKSRKDFMENLIRYQVAAAIKEVLLRHSLNFKDIRKPSNLS